MYNIKTYQEGFIDEQFKIGSADYDTWPMGGQTRPEQLKQAYAADDFDPETRFYAFNNNEMVGFLTSSLKEEKDGKKYYWFESPYVKSGHEAAESQLIEHAMDALKSKGADVLVLRAGEYWGKSQHYAEKYGFTKTQDIARRGELIVAQKEKYNLPEPIHIRDFDYEQDVEGVVDLFATKMNVDKEQIRQSVARSKDRTEGSQIKNPWDQTLTMIASLVAEVEGEVVGRGVSFNVSSFGEHTANVLQITLKEGHEELMHEFISKIVDKARAHGKEKVILHTGLWGITPDDSSFKAYGIPFEMKLAFYEKEL